MPPLERTGEGANGAFARAVAWCPRVERTEFRLKDGILAQQIDRRNSEHDGTI